MLSKFRRRGDLKVWNKPSGEEYYKNYRVCRSALALATTRTSNWQTWTMKDNAAELIRKNRDSKEMVTLSGTVIKLCGVLYAFNIKRSSVEKKNRAELPRRKKNTCRQIGLKKINPLSTFSNDIRGEQQRNVYFGRKTEWKVFWVFEFSSSIKRILVNHRLINSH